MRIISDNREYTGSAKEIVTKMRLEMWLPGPINNEEYMEGVARRATVYCGEEMRYSNEKEFIDELSRLGQIEVVEE